MADFADLMQDGRAAEWRELADRMKNAVNGVLWSEKFEAYYDQQQPDILPQEGNALAVLFGVANEEQSHKVFAALEKHNWSPYGSAMLSREVNHTRGGLSSISPLMCTYEAEARFLCGDDRGALELMRRCWGTMLAKGAETFWEFAYNNGSDRWPIPAHSWSAGCTYLLSSYGAGLRPKEKGYETLLFAPCPLLSDFICVLPTPKGYVAAKAETAEGILRYTLVLPKGMKHSAKLPEKALLCIKEY
jgi:glycogen debranching enzyme